jgi:hypothetical protein
MAVGRAEGARRALETVAAGPRSTRLSEALRLARLRCRDVPGAWRAYEEWLEPFRPALDAAPETDSVRDSWMRAGATREPGAFEEAARAAARVGWLEEAIELATQAGAREIVEEVDPFRRFVRAMGTTLAAAHRDGRAPFSLERALREIAEVGERVLGRDPFAGSRIESHFPVGSLVDTSPGAPGIGSLFARHGFELRLGKRLFGPVEAFALRRIAERTTRGELLGRPCAGREVLGVSRSLATAIESSGLSIAGATLPGSVFLALDVIADDSLRIESIRALREKRRSDRLPAAASEADRLAADEGFEVAERLVLRALERDPSPVAPRLLRIVRDHERGHLADAEELLPVLAHLPTAVGWLLAAGLSRDAIESRLERRAELAALCVSDDPELVLAEILEAAEEPAAAPPHSWGYAELAREFVREADRRPRPELDASHPLMPQLWKLSPERIRSIALALAEREGLTRGSVRDAP